VHPAAVVIGDVTIGSECHIAASAVIRADFGAIAIGDGTSIQDNATVHVDVGNRVIIGRNVIVGHNVVLHDVTIHDGCVVGMGAVLLTNVVCGKGVVIAAGSVLPQGMRIPAGKLVMGNPAKIKKDVPADLAAYAATGVEEYKRLTRLYLETMKEIPR
ncbi:MAG TPA: gamma carbonic anhydrase family protein, partial [Syntrophales bacterium]|nr:gamma carbonic anhydrase family protein [Syntrophales bacterium]